MALECYLKLKGIQGECLDSAFRTKGAIQLLTCGFNGSAGPDRPKNSSIAGVKSQSVWVSDSFKDDPDDLSGAFQTLFGDGPEEKPEETPPEPPAAVEESPQWPFTISVTKTLDSASPALFQKYCLYAFLSRDQAHAQDIQIESGKIWVRKYANGAPSPYIIWHFKQIQLVDFSWSSMDDGNVEESLAFRFRYCRMEYLPQKMDGTFEQPLISQWDLQTNKADAPPISDAAVGV